MDLTCSLVLQEEKKKVEAKVKAKVKVKAENGFRNEAEAGVRFRWVMIFFNKIRLIQVFGEAGMVLEIFFYPFFQLIGEGTGFDHPEV